MIHKMGCDRIFCTMYFVCIGRQERVKAGVFEKLIRVELAVKMLECTYALQISSARETLVSRTMVARSRKKTVSTKGKWMLY